MYTRFPPLINQIVCRMILYLRPSGFLASSYQSANFPPHPPRPDFVSRRPPPSPYPQMKVMFRWLMTFRRKKIHKHTTSSVHKNQMLYYSHKLHYIERRYQTVYTDRNYPTRLSQTKQGARKSLLETAAGLRPTSQEPTSLIAAPRTILSHFSSLSCGLPNSSQIFSNSLTKLRTVSRSVVTTTFSQFPMTACMVQLKDPDSTLRPSTTANLWCIR